MRKQVELTFYVGVCPFAVKSFRLEWLQFREAVISAASEVCGGCTSLEAEGWWKEDGASHAENFSGALGKEKCWLLLLSCEEAKVEKAYEAVKNAICSSAVKFGIETDWVHVTQKEFIGRHFSVKGETNA